MRVAAVSLLAVLAGCASPAEPPGASASASLGADAGLDGPMSAAPSCLPACYYDAIAELAAGCPVSGPCRSNHDSDSPAMTFCLATGTTMRVEPRGHDLTTTFRKKGGDLCYTLESRGRTRKWKDAAEKTVLEVEILDAADPGLQRVTCAGGPAVLVDLDSPPCRISRADAGLGTDGGQDCPLDPHCRL